MKKVVETIAIILTLLTVTLLLLYNYYPLDILLSLTITVGTTAYHFDMRILVGYIVGCIMNNHANYYRRWYKPFSFESKLYDVLKVKQWKGKMPTYNPKEFSIQYHTLEEIVQAMCQSEIVHEVIVILSFLPIIFMSYFGAKWVFILTSIVAALIDMAFVVMQRYNRPRLIRLIEKNQSR